MAFTPIRKITTEDRERLEKTALRFVKRYAPEYLNDICDDMTAVNVADMISQDRDLYPGIRSKWAYAMCRAFRLQNDTKITIGYGYIGRSVD